MKTIPHSLKTMSVVVLDVKSGEIDDLPRDIVVLEHVIVETRNVDERENCDEAEDDGAEEETV
jgi:hypothetical protein